MITFYPINSWAYIATSQIDYLLKILYDSTFNNCGKTDIYTQVYNYLNYRWEYISNNDWLLYSKDKMQVAFNIGLKPRIENGDDYIFAIFTKNDSLFKQEWRLLCFAMRGKTPKKLNIDLYKDESRPVYTPKAPAKFSLSFGFNHIFRDDKDRLSRIPQCILHTFNNLENDSLQRELFCRLIKFALLNDNDNISEYNRGGNGKKQVTTSFDPDRFLICLNLKGNKSTPKKERVLNELPYSYMYPTCMQNPNKPDFVLVFRKKGRGEHTQFIGKTIFDLEMAQISARVCTPDLEDTWLSNDIVNANLDNRK